MAIFSNKIVTAKFLDYPNNTVIEVLYEDDGNLIPFILEVDFTQDDFNDLLNEMSLDEIENNSKEEQEQIRKDAFAYLQEQINAGVDELWENNKARIKSELAKEYQESFIERNTTPIDEIPIREVFNHLVKNNDDHDIVFDLKLYILEDADVTKSKDKKLKLSIRKAKTILELIKIYEEFKGTL